MNGVAIIADCRAAVRLVLLAALLLPSPAVAAPVELKLSFFGAERTDTFRYGVKPFVDAVNAAGQDVVTIKVYPEGRLGRGVAEQAQMVLSGAADIAWVVPGQTPYRFPDNEVLEMPGLFRNVGEGTSVYTHLIAAGMLRGYDAFVVIGAYATAPNIIHSRRPIATLADLGGIKVRTNNGMEAEAVGRFGAIPTVMPVTMLADALSKGAVDATITSPNGLFEFGAQDAARNHFLLGVGTAPLLLVMSRQRFEQLPDPVRALILKFSGERAAAVWAESYTAAEQAALARLTSDPVRRVVEPSAADQRTAQSAYGSMLEGWAGKSPAHARLVAAIKAELAAVRAGRP